MKTLLTILLLTTAATCMAGVPIRDANLTGTTRLSGSTNFAGAIGISGTADVSGTLSGNIRAATAPAAGILSGTLAAGVIIPGAQVFGTVASATSATTVPASGVTSGTLGSGVKLSGSQDQAITWTGTQTITNAVLGSAPWIDASQPPYSAKGDGIADDSAALNAAFATGRRVYVPSGVYRLSGTIDGRCSIYGAGSVIRGGWSLPAFSTGKETRFVPANNSKPILWIKTLNNCDLNGITIAGSGAGTTMYGILVCSATTPAAAVSYPGNGLFVSNCWVGNATYPFYNVGGCNVSLRDSSFVGGSPCITGTYGTANSYVIQMCDLGGPVASGTGRCFEFYDTTIVTISNCEQGNCYDYGTINYGGSIVQIEGGNWESFSTVGPLLTMKGGKLNWSGGRMQLSGSQSAIVRYTGEQNASLSMDHVSGLPILFECPEANSDDASDYLHKLDIRDSSTPRIRLYSDSTFTTVTGTQFVMMAGDFRNKVSYPLAASSFSSYTASGGSVENQAQYGYGRNELIVTSATGSTAIAQYNAFINKDPGSGAGVEFGKPFAITFRTGGNPIQSGTTTAMVFRIGGSGPQVGNSVGRLFNPPAQVGAGFSLLSGTLQAYFHNGTSYTYGSPRAFVSYSQDIIEWFFASDGSRLHFSYRPLSAAYAGWRAFGTIPLSGNTSTYGNTTIGLINNGTTGAANTLWVLGDVQVYNYFPR